MSEAIQIVTTTDNQASAQKIAENLVETRLAACVQIEGPVTSVYRWKGNVETAEEWRCTIKTVRRLYRDVEHRIRQLHSYDEPEILATTVDEGSDSYLDWLGDQVV